MSEQIQKVFSESQAILLSLASDSVRVGMIEQIARKIVESFRRGNKLLLMRQQALVDRKRRKRSRCAAYCCGVRWTLQVRKARSARDCPYHELVHLDCFE